MTLANKLGALGVLIFDVMDGELQGVSRSAAALLLTLHYYPNTTVTQFAQVAGISEPTAVRVLDGLARRGWLERQARIGRTTPLLLKCSGKAEAQALQTARRRVMDGILAALKGTGTEHVRAITRCGTDRGDILPRLRPHDMSVVRSRGLCRAALSNFDPRNRTRTSVPKTISQEKDECCWCTQESSQE